MFASSLITKICSFLTSLILIRILSPDEFGVLSYVLSALTFFIPFSGGGMQHSFLRYAPMFDDKKNRIGLFQYSLYRGLLFSFCIAFVLFLLIPWLNSAVGNTSIYFNWLIFYLFSSFSLNWLKCVTVLRIKIKICRNRCLFVSFSFVLELAWLIFMDH